MEIQASNVYLIEILKTVAFLPLEMYIQEATLSHDKKRFYISRGPAGNLTLGAKNCKVLACGILYSISNSGT